MRFKKFRNSWVRWRSAMSAITMPRLATFWDTGQRKCSSGTRKGSLIVLLVDDPDRLQSVARVRKEARSELWFWTPFWASQKFLRMKRIETQPRPNSMRGIARSLSLTSK